MHAGVVGNVVAVVLERRRVKRQKPQRRHTQRLQIIKLGRQAGKIADSEKYQVKVRDWNRPGNINEFIARVNAVRRDNPALHELTNLRFLATDSDRIICYCKATADLSNVLLVAVNLDPHNPRECSVVVPSEAVGVAPGQSYRVTDLLTGMTYTWAERNYLRLDPQIEPAHILKVRR